jgi:hypothetical protein
MPKTGLKSREVSSDHFSSGVKKNDEIKSTRCVIHLLEAKDLLASDLETGKSDPICFMAISQQNIKPDWDDTNYAENGILFSDVKKSTVNPKWNSIHTFPLVIENVNQLLKSSIIFLFKDEDIQEDGSSTYDNLGEVTIPIQEIMAQGKIVKKTAIVMNPKWIKLSKCGNMRRVDGFVKVSVSIRFDEDDIAPLLQVYYSQPRSRS